MNQLRVVALSLAILLCTRVIECRKGGGGFRSGGFRPTRTGGKPPGPRGRPGYSYKPSYFDKGGIRTFGKIALATYVASKLRPSIGFRPYSGSVYNSRGHFCHRCMSINGSDPGCENGQKQTAKCVADRVNPYCSIEYGITGDNQRYVRRSCNAKLCQSCKSSFLNFTGNSSSDCFPIQCQMCNWRNCNSQSVKEVFDDKWRGCTRDEVSGTEFSESETCASLSIMSNRLLVILLCFTSLHSQGKS